MSPVMILVMGEVGAGKSTFINTAADKPLTKVGAASDLDPCTLTVKHFVIPHRKREVVLVDTPGFNHPTKADGEILKGIVDGLKKNRYPKNIQFGGIIYMHDFSENKKLSSRGEQKMSPTKLSKLSDPESHRVYVVLATVGNDPFDDVAASSCEVQLESIWEKVQTCKFKNTKESACSILDTILSAPPIELKKFQNDLGKICRTLPTPTPKTPPKTPKWSFSRPFGSFF